MTHAHVRVSLDQSELVFFLLGDFKPPCRCLTIQVPLLSLDQSELSFFVFMAIPSFRDVPRPIRASTAMYHLTNQRPPLLIGGLSELPETAPPAAHARREETAKLLQISREMEERRDAKRKQVMKANTRPIHYQIFVRYGTAEPSASPGSYRKK